VPIIVLTSRDVCRRAMLEVIAAVPDERSLQRQVVFVTSFAEAQRAPDTPATCVIDLGSLTGSADEAVASVHLMLASRPWLSFALVVAHADPDLEASIIHGLRDLPSVDLVQPSELRDVERWTNVLRDQFVERHALMIEADLCSACADHGTAVFEDPELRQLLRAAIRIRKVKTLSARTRSKRVGLWRHFKRRWGRSPSQMLSLFRVLWAAHLRHHGYDSAAIARLLRFRNSRQCGRRLGRRLGLRKSGINALSYGEMVNEVARCVTQQASVKGLVALTGSALHRAIHAGALLMVTMWAEPTTHPWWMLHWGNQASRTTAKPSRATATMDMTRRPQASAHGDLARDRLTGL
jgi:hypothetical protein